MPLVPVLFLILIEIVSNAHATFPPNFRQSGAMGFGEDGINFPSFPSFAASRFAGVGRDMDISNPDFNAVQFPQNEPFNNVGDTRNYIPGTSYRYDGFSSGGLSPSVSMSSPYMSDRDEFSTLGSAGFGDTGLDERISYPGIARIHQSTVIPGSDGIGFPNFGTANPFMPGMSDGRIGIPNSPSLGGAPVTGFFNGPRMGPLNQHVSGFSGTGIFPSYGLKGSSIFGKKRSGIY